MMAATLVGLTLFGPASPAGHSQTEKRLVAKTSSLSSRAPGGSGALASGSLTQDLMAGRLKATITLASVPTAPGRRITIGLGENGPGGCEFAVQPVVDDPYAPSGGVTRSGRVLTVNLATDAAEQLRFDCAGVALTSGAPGSSPVLDAIGGSLVERQSRLKVSIASTTNVKRGVTKTLSFTITNSGNIGTQGVRLKVSGSGVRFAQTSYSLGTVWAGSSRTVKVKVRVDSIHDRTVTGTVTSTHVDSVSEKTALRVDFPRSKAVPGRYAGPNGASFHLTSARHVRWFKMKLLVRCGGYPSYTYATNYYRMPTKWLSASGRLDAVHSTSSYTTRLTLVFDGSRVRSGKFSYRGPGGCFGSRTVTATRR